MSSFKSTVERIRALESERRNLLLEIEELKRMAVLSSSGIHVAGRAPQDRRPKGAVSPEDREIRQQPRKGRFRQKPPEKDVPSRWAG